MNSDADFQARTVRLNEPATEALRDAFAALPRRGCLTCECRWERRLEVLEALEESGAFALRFEPLDGFARVRVVALKGKSGPCYDTGRTAVYLGDAAAVLDDDRHLIVGAIRVCEKTGGLYALWPYRGVLSVSEPDPELLARLDSEPVPFDCNTFDADSCRLAGMLENVQRAALNAQRAPAVYPGPFRALVLKDGSVVRRGVAALVPEPLAGQNGLLRLPAALAQEARPCETYTAACRERGAAFVLEPLGSGARCVTARAEAAERLTGAAQAALRATPPALKRRLLQLIAAREPYLVLTGSDPDVAGGCCPSTQVGAANRLVAAGALQSYAPPAPPESCTATFYAFLGEIGGQRPELEGERPCEPRFLLCEAVRAQAAAALRDDRWDGAKRAARVVVLALLGVSLGLSAWRTLEGKRGGREARLCAVCQAVAELTQRAAGRCGLGAFGAVSLGALAAAQPCSLALLAGALALAWKPGERRRERVSRACALAAGASVANAALAGVATWGVARLLGGAGWLGAGVGFCRGPLLILAGALLTGALGSPAQSGPDVRPNNGPAGLFFLGALCGVAWCPVGAGLFFGVLLPMSLSSGAPLRTALLYGAGYALPVLAVCLALAAGGRLVQLRSAGRRVNVAAGLGLILLGVLAVLG